jgi:hypothetical protein
MSGFLSNLLARSRGTAEVVRPRLSSLFEPADSNWSGTALEDMSEAFDEAPTPVGAPAPGEPLGAPEPGKVVHRKTLELETPLQVETSSRVEPIKAEAPGPGWLQPLQLKGMAPTQLSPATPNAPMAERRARVPELREPSRTTPVPAPPVALARKRESVPPTQPWLEAQPPRDSTRLREGTLTPAQKVSGVRDQPPLTPPAQRPRFQPLPSQLRPAVSEPAVQVTIGRIEVRAVTEAGPRKQERAASPVMSLNDYLKTRAGGGNR